MTFIKTNTDIVISRYTKPGCSNWGKQMDAVGSESKSDNRAFAVRTAPKAQIASAPGLADKAQAKSAASAAPPKKIESFSREQSGVITDGQNGLLWRVGPDEDIDWPHAKAWVTSWNVRRLAAAQQAGDFRHIPKGRRG